MVQSGLFSWLPLSDVVGSESILDISIYDRGSTIRGTSNEEFIGFVRLKPTLKEADDTPVHGWYALTGYDKDDSETRGEIYVEAVFQKTEKKHHGPNDFQILKLIGKGRSGFVYQVRKKGTKQIYALKSVPKDLILAKTSLENQDSGHQKNQVDDITILVRGAAAESLFILSIKFAFETLENLHVIVDYTSGGGLFWHLQKEGRFDEMRAKFYIAEIILALQHLHHHGIVSYILKPQGILLDANGHISLCDFGLSKASPKQDTEVQEYLAPEIIDGLTSYTKVAHFWSLGVLAFEMTCGWSPFYAEDTEQLHKNILHYKVRFPRDALSVEGRNFVKGLLHKGPETRLGAQGGAEELKSHPFFEDTEWDRLSQRLVLSPFKPKPDLRYSNFEPEFAEAINFAFPSSLQARAEALARVQPPDQPLSPVMQATFQGFTFVDESNLDAENNCENSDIWEDLEMQRADCSVCVCPSPPLPALITGIG